jgi:hypothetical protein
MGHLTVPIRAVLEFPLKPLMRMVVLVGGVTKLSRQLLMLAVAPPAHQYVIGVRVKYCAMGNWRASMSTMRVDSCEVSSDSRKNHKSKPADARSGSWRLAVVRGSLAMHGP